MNSDTIDIVPFWEKPFAYGPNSHAAGIYNGLRWSIDVRLGASAWEYDIRINGKFAAAGVTSSGEEAKKRAVEQLSEAVKYKLAKQERQSALASVRGVPVNWETDYLGGSVAKFQTKQCGEDAGTVSLVVYPPNPYRQALWFVKDNIWVPTVTVMSGDAATLEDAKLSAMAALDQWLDREKIDLAPPVSEFVHDPVAIEEAMADTVDVQPEVEEIEDDTTILDFDEDDGTFVKGYEAAMSDLVRNLFGLDEDVEVKIVT